MTDEILMLGEKPVIVTARDACNSTVSQDAANLATLLLSAVSQGNTWDRSLIGNVATVDFMDALQVFADEYAAANVLGPFELDDVVTQAACCLSRPHRLFAQWVMEVRIGLRAVWQSVKHLVAVSFVTPPSGMAYTKQAVAMGHAYPIAVLHASASGDDGQFNLAFRGYGAYFCSDGMCQVGARAGNLWLKNGWMLPGIKRVADVTAARMRSVVRKQRQRQNQPDLTMDDLPSRESCKLHTECEQIASRMRAKRPDYVCEENFEAAQGRQLDLENVAVMVTFLSLVRSLRAKVTYDKYNQLLDRVADDVSYYRNDIIDDPELAGAAADDVRRYAAARNTAAKYHKHVGELTLPTYYAGFSPTAPPKVLCDVSMHSLDGVTELCMRADELAVRQDRTLLLSSASMLRGLESFEQIISYFGTLLVFEKVVVEYVEEFRVGTDSYDSRETAEEGLAGKYAGSEAQITKHIAFRLEGEDNIRDMPIRDFRNVAKFKIVPQVLAHQRNGTELNFHRDGVYVGLSATQNSKFKQWKRDV